MPRMPRRAACIDEPMNEPRSVQKANSYQLNWGLIPLPLDYGPERQRQQALLQGKWECRFVVV